MHRIDHVTRKVNANGTGKDGFTGGDPALQIAPTTVTPEWLNAVQEEIANAIGLAGGALIKAQNNQLASILTLQFDAISLGTMVATSSGTLYAGVQAVANDADGMRIVIAGDDSGTGGVWYSDNGGKSWLAPTTYLAPRNRMNSVANGNGLWVAAGESADLRTSPDALVWTKRTPGNALGGTFKHVHYASALGRWFVAGTNNIQTSTDGVTWTGIPLPNGFAAQANRITSDSTRVLTIAGKRIFTSVDGLNWFETTFDTAPVADLAAIAAVPSGGYLAVSSADLTAEGRYGWRSSDGLTWTRQNLEIGSMNPDVRIVSRTGAIIGARPSDGALCIAMPSGLGYAPAVAVVPGAGSASAAQSVLFRTGKRWFGRVNDVFFTSAITVY